MNQAERSAWVEELADRHGRMVFGVAWHVLGRVEDAEDVLQEVFLKVLNAGPPAESVKEWGAYLRVMATRSAIDLLRRRKRGVCVNAEDLDEIPDPSDATPRDQAERNEHMNLLRQGLATLPPKDAQIFALRHFEDLSYEELADRFGMPVSRVGVKLHRARKRLVEWLSPLLKPAAVKETSHERTAR
ncbi:sigma-70 family RNA polymerase sigma factor [bacterium]|nr:sigma-70 family RNA polymerase sigma factor [bacterium]